MIYDSVYIISIIDKIGCKKLSDKEKELLQHNAECFLADWENSLNSVKTLSPLIEACKNEKLTIDHVNILVDVAHTIKRFSIAYQVFLLIFKFTSNLANKIKGVLLWFLILYTVAASWGSQFEEVVIQILEQFLP